MTKILIAVTFLLACMLAQAPPASSVSHMQTDIQVGSRYYNVGYSGEAEWMADINGDGRADYVYNKEGSYDYRVLLADQRFPYGTGDLQADKKAGSRNSNNGVGYGGKAQWMADVNGDGKADYVYNKDGTREYWVMLGKSDGTFQTDKKAGSRHSGNGVGYDDNAQWMADVNGDGRADYVYNNKGTEEYWVMLANSDGTFQADMKAGSRHSGNKVGYSGNAQWMADVNGDGRADYVYNKDGSGEYWVMLANEDGTFQIDMKAGSRDSQNGVGYGGQGQWLIDVSGDGRADFVYNKDASREYWVMRGKGNGTFDTDVVWGSRYGTNDVGYDINGQGFADLNSDGREDFFYNLKGTAQYWAMLSEGNRFAADQYWAQRNSNNNIGYDGRGSWLTDTNGDGLADLIYNRADTDQLWSTLSIKPRSLARVHLLDVWGEGYIHYGSLTSGFQDSLNLNLFSQKVSSGPNSGLNIPSLVSVNEYDNPVFPIDSGSVEIITVMNSPIVTPVAQEMYRVLNKNTGYVILYGYVDGDSSLQNFEDVFLGTHGFYNVTSKVTLQYPFDTITFLPARVYSSRSLSATLSLGKGGRVGGAGLSDSDQNSFSGGGIVHDEL